MYAAVALKRLRVPLTGRVALVFVPDEAAGGQRGSGFLAATSRLGINGIGMLTPEPTSGVVWNANRGALTVRVTVHGREAHGIANVARAAYTAISGNARASRSASECARKAVTTTGCGSAQMSDQSASPGVLIRKASCSIGGTN